MDTSDDLEIKSKLKSYNWTNHVPSDNTQKHRSKDIGVTLWKRALYKQYIIQNSNVELRLYKINNECLIGTWCIFNFH